MIRRLLHIVGCYKIGQMKKTKKIISDEAGGSGGFISILDGFVR